MKFTNKQILFGLILVAFLLRFPGIFDGLPAVYNSTEYYHAKLAMSMGARQSLDPQISNYDVYNPTLYIYPMFYQYLILIQYVLIYLVGSIFSVFKSSYDFAIQFLISPSIFYIVGRFVNILVSLLTIFTVFKKMSKIFSDQIGLISGSIFTLSYFMNIASQQAVSDIWLIFFCTISTLYFLDFLKEPSGRKIILASVFTGLAIGTKYNAGVLLILFFYILWIERNWFFTKNIKYVFYSGLALLVSFLITNPYWIIRFPQFLEGLMLINAQASEAIALERGINYLWEFLEIVRFELVVGIGFFVSMVYFILKRNKQATMLLLMIIITFLYVGSWQKKGIDYLYPVFPAWIFILSMFINEIINWIKEKELLKNYVLLLIFVPSILMSGYQIVLKLNLDTRELATKWIVENINQQDKICYDNYQFDLGLFDLNRYIGYGAGSSQIPDQLKSELRGYKNHPNNYSFNPITYKTENDVKKEQNLYKQEKLMYKRKTIKQLIGEDTKYFISNNWFYKPYFEVNPDDFSESTQKNISEIISIYNNLGKNFKIVQKFEPDLWTNGPEITVYSLNQ